MYGTAWKEDRTKELTLMAIKAGFKAIDTANQRKHYHEALVGEAVLQACQENLTTRENLFLQTKFTFLAGQDQRLPYDKNADTPTQVNQSFAKSLVHLNTDYLDSFVLHGPSTRYGLAQEDWDAWKTMTELYYAKKTKHLGISNVSADQLTLLLDKAEVKPDFVQNRCYARLGWDKEIRKICKVQNIVYQGFSLLTANIHELNQPIIHGMAQKYDCHIPQIVFRFAQQIGMLPLTGTSSYEHMLQDLACDRFDLSQEELLAIENLSA